MKNSLCIFSLLIFSLTDNMEFGSCIKNQTPIMSSLQMAGVNIRGKNMNVTQISEQGLCYKIVK